MHFLGHFSAEFWPLVNAFDATVIHFVNSFARHSVTFDSFIELIGDTNLLKGGLCMALFTWAWFVEEPRHDEKQEFLLYAFVASTVALLVGRLISLQVPMRLRPMHNPALNFHIPFGLIEDPHSWNSMPSDHAVLFCCLATSLCFVSWRLGALAWAQTILVVFLPRVYMGYHYPSDLIAGALLGIAAAYTAKWVSLRKRVAETGFRWLAMSPASFYAFCFIWFFEVSELFGSPLMIFAFVRHTLRQYLVAKL